MTDEQEVAAIPLVEERVSVEKREVETGRYRIKVRVEKRQDMVPAELSHDEVEIERIPMNQTLTQLPSVRLEAPPPSSRWSRKWW
jgi:stress response protein YsnF